MRKSSFLVITILLLVLLNLFQLMVHYSHWFTQKPSIHEEGSGYVLRQLHFDRSQADQYKVFIDDHKGKVNALKSDLFSSYADLYRLVEADTLSTLKSDSIQTRICQLYQSINTENLSHFEDVKGLCRKEQLPYFSAFVDEMLIRLGPEKNK